MAKRKLEFEDGPILVDLSQVKPKGGTIGYRDTEQNDKADADQAERSNEAIDHALETVYRTAKRVSTMMKSLEDEPVSKMQMEFGLTLKEDASVMIAKVGPEIHFRVKLTWKNETEN